MIATALGMVAFRTPPLALSSSATGAGIPLNNQIRTTFFTSANRRYEMFVLPYIIGALTHNPDARVEICLENTHEFLADNSNGIRILLQHFGETRILLRDIVTAIGVSPNSVRFLETPEVITKYTYIGDIDILILEAVSQRHIDRMAHEHLPYSNVLRAGRRALSGLHFTRSEAYYPVCVPPGTNLNLDEELLYSLVMSRRIPLPPKDWRRPMHGYHLSPNRSPLPRFVDGKRTVHWGLDKSRAHFKAYCALQRRPVWREMFPCFDRRYRLLLGLLDLALSSVYWRYRTNRVGQITGLLTDLGLIEDILASDQ